jgi:cytochrome c oxidase cbb3-type subunit 3
MDFKNTSDFVSGFWSMYVIVITLVSVLGCGLLLLLQDKAKTNAGQTTGHVWDETLEEYNNPLPNWWRWMFYITVVFSLVYLALYPGLGNMAGSFGWTMRGQYETEMKKADEQYGPIFKKFQAQDIRAVAANSEAKEMGQRLFLTYCAQCHGSDAKGAKGFPNLTDQDWQWGGDARADQGVDCQGSSCRDAGQGVKPDLNGDQIKDLANYVRSLSGLAADSTRVQRGKEQFGAACSCLPRRGWQGHARRCAQPDRQGLAVWQLGSDIVETIAKGRVNRMPAFGEFLGDAKAHADCVCLRSRRRHQGRRHGGCARTCYGSRCAGGTCGKEVKLT